MKLVWTLSFIVLGYASLAQKPSFGAKAGLNISSLHQSINNTALLEGEDLDDYLSWTSKPGFYIGALVSIPLTKQLSIRPELVYSSEGSNLTAKVSSTETDKGKGMLNYLNIPIMVQYKLKSGFFAEAGPQIGILLSAKGESDGEVNKDKDAWTSFNAGIAAGIGYYFSSGFGINMRYALGLKNIISDKGNNRYDRALREAGYELKQRTFSIGVFYSFEFDKKGKK